MWDDALASLKALAEAEEARRRRGPAEAGSGRRAGAPRRGAARGGRRDDRTGPRPRPHRDDRRPAGDGVPLLHRLRALRRLVGRGLADRAEARGGRPHPLPERASSPAARSSRSRRVERVVFTYGFESGQPIPIGASRVTITLEETPRGTVVRLQPRAAHRRGARRARPGLALPARGLRERRGAGGARRRRRARRPLLRAAGARPTRRSAGPSSRRSRSETLAFRDPYSCTDGLDDLERPHRRRPEVHAGRRPRAAGRGPPVPGHRRSWTGRSRAPTAALARRARTSSSSPPTAASPASPGSGAERARSRPARVPGGRGGRSGRGGGDRRREPPRPDGRLPCRPAASPSPRSGRCRSARSARPAGWRGSCASRPTASPATSTSSGRTSARASGSAAPPRAGSARPTGSTARSRSPGSSTTRRSRRGSPATSTTSSTHQRAGRLVRARTPRTPRTKRYDLWAILLANKVLVQYHEATGDAARARGRRAEPAGAARRPRPHAALRLGPLPLVRGARLGLLRLRADARAVAPRPRAQAARAGRRLRGPLPHRGRHGADAAARPLEVDEARREHGDGHQGGRPVVAARPAARPTAPSPRA